MAFDDDADVAFDETICRNIAVDIRYVLFVIHRIGGAGYLFGEMDFGKSRQKHIADPSADKQIRLMRIIHCAWAAALLSALAAGSCAEDTTGKRRHADHGVVQPQDRQLSG